MKYTLFVSSILTVFILTSCTNYKQIEYKGISLKIPSDLSISYNNFSQFNGENIDIKVTHTGLLMFECAKMEAERSNFEGGKSIGDFNKKYETALNSLRDTGNINDVIEKLESLTCGWAGSNLSVKPISIDGINGVVYNKVTGNSGLPSISTYFKQILLVGPGEKVYSLTFNYEFGELGKYIESRKDSFGEAILNDSETYKYEQVGNFLKYGSSITDANMKGFEHNDKVINKIINSIKFYN